MTRRVTSADLRAGALGEPGRKALARAEEGP